MKYRRSYGLVACIPTVIISVPPGVQMYLSEMAGHPLNNVTDGLLMENGGEYLDLYWSDACNGIDNDFCYQISCDHADIPKQLPKLAKLLAALNEVPIAERSKDDQLIELSLETYDCQAKLTAEMNLEMFEWCRSHFLVHSVAEADMRRASADIWSVISPDVPEGKPEAEALGPDKFQCLSDGKVLQLGHARGSQSGLIAPSGLVATMVVDDCSLLLAALLIYQLALIEQAYRVRGAEDDSDEPGEI